MGKNPCTAVGYAAAKAELQALTCRGRFRQNADTGGELSEEGMVTARELVDREVSSVQGRINSLKQFVSSHTPQPPPTQFETVELGHPVTIVYSNKQGKELHKKYVTGGAGEPEIYLGSGAMMLNINSPLGKLLIGKRVGDVFDAFLSGHDCEVRVEAIHQLLAPDQADDEVATPSAPDVSVTRLSIKGSLEHVAA